MTGIVYVMKDGDLTHKKSAGPKERNQKEQLKRPKKRAREEKES
jgi:hypothetical protein